MDKKQKKRPLLIALLLTVNAVGVVFTAGCRPKPALTASAPLSAEAAKTQARDKQVQKYITKRRTQARKVSKTHTVH